MFVTKKKYDALLARVEELERKTVVLVDNETESGLYHGSTYITVSDVIRMMLAHFRLRLQRQMRTPDVLVVSAANEKKAGV